MHTTMSVLSGAEDKELEILGILLGETGVSGISIVSIILLVEKHCKYAIMFVNRGTLLSKCAHLALIKLTVTGESLYIIKINIRDTQYKMTHGSMKRTTNNNLRHTPTTQEIIMLTASGTQKQQKHLHNNVLIHLRLTVSDCCPIYC